jgi:hypothetical protein
MITPKKTSDQVGEHNHYFQESEVLLLAPGEKGHFGSGEKGQLSVG